MALTILCFGAQPKFPDRNSLILTTNLIGYEFWILKVPEAFYDGCWKDRMDIPEVGIPAE